MAGAISGTTIAAIAAMVAGAALQYKAQTDAQKRRTQETLASLARQDALQKKAEQVAQDASINYDSDKRDSTQQQIADELTQAYTAPVKSANDIAATATTTQGDTSSEYSTAKAKSDLEQMKSAETLARLFGKVGSASKLRNNEALAMSDAAGRVAQLGNYAQGQAGADQIAIQNAGVPDAGMQLAGGLLSAAGSYGIASGAGTAGKVTGTGVTGTASTSANAASPFATGGGGIGYTGTGTIGVKIPNSFKW
jgi:hypothetical protein